MVMVRDNLEVLQPGQNILHFITDLATANSSSSITAYHVSVGVRKWELACMRTHCPVADNCCKTNPNPCLLASVHKHMGFCTSKNARAGTLPFLLMLFSISQCLIMFL